MMKSCPVKKFEITLKDIQAYKALSVVANVKQGEIMKKLIEENLELRRLMDLRYNHHMEKIQELEDRLEEEDIYKCVRCYEYKDSHVGGEKLEDVGDGGGDLPNGWYCEDCIWATGFDAIIYNYKYICEHQKDVIASDSDDEEE